MVTTKIKILNYLQYKEWVSGSELESMAERWYTKSSVISRRARELVNEGKLERGMSSRKTVQYRFARPSLTTQQATSYLEKLRVEEERENQVSLI